MAEKNNPIVHIELSSNDAEKMKKFYGGAFGWTFQDFPEMNYTTFSSGEGSVGGGFNPVSADFPAGTTLLYLHTDDLEGVKKRIRSEGGTIVLEAFEIPTVGVMAIFLDPSGNQVALLQPEPGSQPA